MRWLPLCLVAPLVFTACTAADDADVEDGKADRDHNSISGVLRLTDEKPQTGAVEVCNETFSCDVEVDLYPDDEAVLEALLGQAEANQADVIVAAATFQGDKKGHDGIWTFEVKADWDEEEGEAHWSGHFEQSGLKAETVIHTFARKLIPGPLNLRIDMSWD
jgi:hypothetical protein